MRNANIAIIFLVIAGREYLLQLTMRNIGEFEITSSLSGTFSD